MRIPPFRLERYFARYEFSAAYLLSCSDCEPLTLNELLSMSDDESLRLWEDLSLGYTESQGHPLLREEVAQLYDHIVPGNVLVVTPEEGIFIAMNVLLESGDHVIATYPGYQSLYELAHSLGCEVSQWIPEKRQQWEFDVDMLRSAIRPNTRLIVINFPHNPTGAMLSQRNMRELLSLARENGIQVFSDEMYRFLEYDEEARLPSASDLCENAVSLFGVSKALGLAGLRIGWLITRNRDLLQKLATFKDYTTICSSAPSEILALMALRTRTRIVDRNLNIIKHNLSLIESFFSDHADAFEWIRPKAGSVAFPALRLPLPIREFCADLVNKKGVMLVPGDVYDFQGNNFRIGFGRTNLPEGLDQLEAYLGS